MRRNRFTFLLLFLVMTIPACQPQNNGLISHENCRPAYRLIRTASVEPERSDIWRYELNGILMGCKSDLESLNSADMAMIRDRITTKLDQRKLMPLMKINMEKIRDRICSEINTDLGRSVISDVFFYHVQFEENRWFSTESGRRHDS